MLPSYILIFVTGTSFGSFANVCIYRIPRRVSIVAPRSFCPNCRRTLSWYELIPVLSYLLLSGRCRSCGARISIGYPVVELLGGAIFLFFVRFGTFSIEALAQALFFLVLLVVAFIDWEHLVIPNGLLIAGLVIGVVAKSLISFRLLGDAAIDGLLAGIATFMVRAMGNLAFKKDTMGMGDVKFSILIGFFIGFGNFLIAVWLASVLGVLYWTLKRLTTGAPKDIKLPFGSFLSMASVVVFLASGHIDALIQYSIIPLFHPFD
jgi:leader peptidase (prepilin peptidase) / N-methyltransferase